MARRMTRARTGTAAGVVLAAVLIASAGFGLAGCGVPSSGPATDFDAPQTDVNAEDGRPQEVLLPQGTPLDSMNNYLRAAAVEPGSRVTRLAEFYTSPPPSKLTEDTTRLTIIDAGTELVSIDGDRAQVQVRGSVIGEYDQYGEFQTTGSRSFSQAFQLARQDDGKWRLTNRPEQVLLSQKAFNANYEVSPLYFPVKGSRQLVPDVRYVYKYQSADRKRTDLVNWMLHGPSASISPAVDNGFPPQTTLAAPSTVTTTAGTTVVDLTGAAATVDGSAAAEQLAWTMWKVGADSDLDVQINGTSIWHGPRGSLEPANPAAVSPNSTIHYVADGRIEPEMTAYNTAELAKSVASAALGTRKLAVAHDNGALSIISMIQSKDSTGPTPSAQEVTGLPSGPDIGRPAWIDGNMLLVPKKGGLYVVQVDEQGTGKALATPIASGVTEVSVAPDGTRIAMVMNGRAYVTVLQRNGGIPQEITAPRLVGLDITKVKDVGWMKVQSLVVLGQGDKGVLHEVTIDNSSVVALPDLGGTSLVPTQVASICDNPKDAQDSISVYVTVDGQIYQLQSAGLRPYTPGQAPGTTGSAPFYA